MSKQMDKYKLSLAGEYRVCSELLRRGLLASVVVGNQKSTDIHIVTSDGRVIVIEVKTTTSNKFLTKFFQKFETENKGHPDFWVLCRLNEGGDEFFILSHREMAIAQAKRNGLQDDFIWEEAYETFRKGVDSVLKQHVACHIDSWNKIVEAVTVN
ncbi:MAG: hypothetical protein AVO35_10370 [Candidatus Aegiribacteria sp. MLS_C]|nr:MAG: hypothetical protein AVO35_10370 [Candidatus Aegiribacteria sp. MLS_C]